MEAKKYKTEWKLELVKGKTEAEFDYFKHSLSINGTPSGHLRNMGFCWLAFDENNQLLSEQSYKDCAVHSLLLNYSSIQEKT